MTFRRGVCHLRRALASGARVELARDGSSARVWFSMSEPEASLATTLAAFEHAAGSLRSRLCDALPLKRSPELRFRHDPAAHVSTVRLERTK